MTVRSASQRNPWVGASFGNSSLELARRLSRAYDQELSTDSGDDASANARTSTRSGDRPEPVVRPVVRSSWRRCLQTGVDPDRAADPPNQSPDDTSERWRTHPLRPFTTTVEQMLGRFAYDAGHIVVIADADGCLLWSKGHPKVLAASEQIEFTPGHDWSERTTGTNGVGTALAVDHPIQIFASEHFRRPVHKWVCAGAPVHDPATGKTLGVIDVSSGIRAAHPYALALVSATADMVETLLRGHRAAHIAALKDRFHESRRPGPRALVDEYGVVIASDPEGWIAGRLFATADGWLAPGQATVLAAEPFAHGAQIVSPTTSHARPELRITPGSVTLARQELRLSPRHRQILRLLIANPEGLYATDLAEALYGDAAPQHQMSVRAEVSRLRRRLGGFIAANPYRLLLDVTRS